MQTSTVNESELISMGIYRFLVIIFSISGIAMMSLAIVGLVALMFNMTTVKLIQTYWAECFWLAVVFVNGLAQTQWWLSEYQKR